MELPRSIRTFNPGAMNFGPFAQRHGAIGSDGRLAIFPDEATGYKAMGALLDVYGRRGQNTVASIIGGLPDKPNLAWAPRGVDNNSTDTYIQKVASKLGISPNAPVPPDMREPLMRAMAEYEAGVPLGSVPRPSQPVQPVQSAQGATMTPQAPQLPAYTGATPNDVETQRKMAQALMMQGMSTEPVGHWTQALARVLQGASGGMYQAQARKGEQQGTQALAQMLGGGGTPDAGALIQNPWTRDIGTKIAVARMDPNAGKTDPIKEYEYAVKNGFKGSLQDWKISSKANQGEYNKVPIFGIGADGKPVMLQTGSRGDAVATKLPEGVSVNAQKPIEIDAGDRTILLDPITRTPIREVPKNIAEAGRQKAVGTAQGEAQVNLPTVESNAKQLLDYVDSVANDKNLDRMLGYGGYLPNVSTGARTMQSKINQLNSNAFLNAFERLKGGGAITEVEGRTATEAMTRLREMVQDGKDYREALRDFRNEVSRLLEVARRKAGAGGPSGNAGLPAQGQPAQGLAPGSYNWTPQGLQPAQ